MEEKKIKDSIIKIALISSMALILLLIILFAVLYFLNRKPLAAFYGISDKTRDIIVQNLESSVKTREGKRAYDILVLNDKISLPEAMKNTKKIDILFIKDGANARYAYDYVIQKNLGFPKDEVLSGMTTSIKQTVTDYKDKKYIEKIPENLSEEQRKHILEENRFYLKTTAIPILLDNYEIDVKYEVFTNSKIGSINYWKDLEKLSEFSKEQGLIPLLFAGGDDRELLNIVGALTESLSGRSDYEKAVKKLAGAVSSRKKAGSELYEATQELISEGNPLYSAVQFLKDWKAKGYLPRIFTQLKKNDLLAYANSDETAILLMSLEAHRTYSDSIIRKYRSIYFPSDAGNQSRSFTAPVIMAVSLSKKEMCRNSIKLLGRNLQEKLTFGSGLAPAMANCAIPDKQADDARYWIAATEKPLTPLSDAAFVSDSNRAIVADVIRAELNK